MKRKYTRKPVQAKSDGLNYSDLPLTLREEIDKIIAYRKRLNLFDDTVERKEKALRYYIWRMR